MQRLRTTLILTLALSGLAVPAQACTTFLCEDGQDVLIGKSYDWHQGAGLVLVNKRGVAKKALVLEPGATPAQWTSRYGSITFNQYGREMPNGGMNTAGLVVEVMWLRASRYPAPDKRPTLNELQWIQYQLDRFATVKEMVEHAPSLRVSTIYAKVHYLACDKGGECAAFEYVDGKLKVAHGEHVTALTNDTLARSESWLNKRSGVPGGRSSLERFGKAVRLPGKLTDVGERDVLSILDAVSQGEYTKWAIVYDPRNLTVSWRTHDAPTLKRARLKAFDTSCSTPVSMFDANSRAKGDVTDKFAPYTLAANKQLLRTTTSDIADSLPPGAVWLLAGYPNTHTCTLTTP